MSQEPSSDKVAAGGPGEGPRPDYYDQLLRLKAEFENFRKRTDREKPEYYRLGKTELLLEFLNQGCRVYQAQVLEVVLDLFAAELCFCHFGALLTSSRRARSALLSDCQFVR